MDNVVIINQSKKNELQFDLQIEGLDTKDINVRFIIESTEFDIGFVCKKESDKKWSVNIPPMPLLKKTTFPFYIDVNADGYHFKPLTGVINVEGSHQVYASTPESIQSPLDNNSQKGKEKKSIKLSEGSKPRLSGEPTIEDIANRILGKQKPEYTKREKISEETKKEIKFDDVIHQILNQEVKNSNSGLNTKWKRGKIISS